MAAWDWYPYDVYCGKLAGDWLWGGAGPAANLANPGSTFSVKLAEAMYFAYRKGGFVFAETFKDCVAQRYGALLSVDIAPGSAPSASEFAAAISLRLVREIARAKADMAAEDRTAALKAGVKYVARETVEPESRLRALLTRPLVPMQPLGPMPTSPYPAPAYPASVELGELFVNRTWQGYSYRALADPMVGHIAAELNMMRVKGDVNVQAGAMVAGKVFGWIGGVAPDNGDADDWALGQKAAGRAVLLGATDTAPEGMLEIVNVSPDVGEAYAVATRDISVVSSICQRDPAAAVLYEPRDGWVEPSADELAKGKEAGVGVPRWALYAGGAAVLVGVGYYAFQAGKKG